MYFSWSINVLGGFTEASGLQWSKTLPAFCKVLKSHLCSSQITTVFPVLIRAGKRVKRITQEEGLCKSRRSGEPGEIDQRWQQFRGEIMVQSSQIGQTISRARRKTSTVALSGGTKERERKIQLHNTSLLKILTISHCERQLLITAARAVIIASILPSFIGLRRWTILKDAVLFFIL